jgi:hypothetical protein
MIYSIIRQMILLISGEDYKKYPLEPQNSLNLRQNLTTAEADNIYMRLYPM